jgi:transcriptional regulator GlxA family with amidase domain
MNIAILIFDGAEELDFVGPWEVFTVAAKSLEHRGRAAEKPNVFLVSERGGLVTCAKGMRVEAHHSFATAPQADVILVPGGIGTRREVTNSAVMSWIAAQAVTATWTTSVCTGSLLLVGAGPAEGRAVTTHWAAMDEIQQKLAELGKTAVFVRARRWVVDGTLITAAGVSAGIDMALWLVGQLYGEDIGRAATRIMEYDPAPPYPFA